MRNDRDIDGLTGLANKRCFEEFLQLHEKERHSIGCALLLDLDHFKEVNDSFGHDEGDFILAKAAQILSDTFRRTDCVARICGDEFAVFFTAPIKEEDAIEFLREKVNILLARTPILVEKNELKISVTFSIGVCIRHIDFTTSPRSILSMADTVMYKVKNTTKNAGCIDAFETLTETVFPQRGTK